MRRLNRAHVRQAQRLARLPVIEYDTTHEESPSEATETAPDGLDDPEGTEDASTD